MPDRISVEFMGKPGKRSDINITFFGNVIPLDLLAFKTKLSRAYSFYLQELRVKREKAREKSVQETKVKENSND